MSPEHRLPFALPRRAVIRAFGLQAATLALPALLPRDGLAAREACLPEGAPGRDWVTELCASMRRVGPTGARSAPPPGAVAIAPGANIQAAIDRNPPGTAFALGPGTFRDRGIRPKPGNSFHAARPDRDTILDGGGAPHAFRGQGISGVRLGGLHFTNWAPPRDSIGVLGTDGSAPGWRVEGCTFLGNAGGSVLMLGNGMQVENCRFLRNANCGIGGWRLADVLVRNCEIAFNNQGREWPFTPTGSAAGAKLTRTTKLRFLNNHVHDNQQTFGLWLDIDCSDSLIAGNLIERNEVGGLLVELDHGAIVRDNVIRDNNVPLASGFKGGGIYVQNSSNAEIRRNLIAGNGGGVWVFENERGAGSRGPWRTRNAQVRDNLIVMEAGYNGMGGTAQNEPSNRFQGNAYRLSGSAAFMLGREVDLAAWRARGHDTPASGALVQIGASPPR